MSDSPIGKLPPQNLEAEQSLLGSLLIDKDAIIKVGDIVCGDDFYSDHNKTIFECIADLYSRHEPIDILSLANLLEERGKLKNIGGRSALISLSNAVPSASHVIHYAKIIQKKATLRRLLSAAAEITALGYNEEDDLAKVLDISEQKLFGVSQKYLRQAFVPLNNLLTDAFERIDDLHKNAGKLRGIPTGFRDLDNKLAGLQKSNLVILAARPSMGKTSLALDFARNIATKQKVPVGIFSLEMSKEELVDRLLCAESRVGLWELRTGKLSDKGENDDFTRIGMAMGNLAEAPIYIDDSGTLNVMELRTKARRLQMEHNLGVIFVDYLQLMEGRSTESRVQEISEISRALKSLARELDIPIVALSQLSRAVETRGGTPIPKLADLRDSGSIEQDADVVMFIYRKKMYNKELSDRTAEIHISKHRNGPTGVVELYFDELNASFKNLDKTHDGM
ncbi:replicative DNA helicase [Candidatus Falkowbacteria bacterium RBG_13_39_14]|uniref:Replicative DNA helicase n=1 Tax=Candidatus Falkowbacteria bacterium RBG_13_39_14 TaxID=1797985 RepID=A0A1F5S114_9BACT|nr:MAG: replicative DNA helicase [Candidatus Falkowbacteria bacterium RBG_13_39_14]